MSKINKLIIQGIRSFEGEDTSGQLIEFFSPLTLIVGINGSGKTTIIEALKYSLTGEYPPGSARGNSFINDPKLSTGYEVNAMVKLEVVDAKGDLITVTKRLRATQVGKGSNVTTKAIEGTIHRKPVGGPVVQISGKCLDIKEEMCRIMGVSDAIINNVIFCHQEDSCWPLDEGKKVKEKFDAIFNTTQYNKCFEHLTKSEKEMTTKIKIEREALVNAKSMMLMAKEKKEQLEELNIKLQVDLDQLTKYEKDLEELGKRLKELEDLQSKYTKISAQVSQSKGKIQNIEEEMKRLKANIKEPYPGTIEELETSLSTFSREYSEKKEKLNTLEKMLKIKTGELIKLNSLKENFLKEEGIFEKREKDNETRIVAIQDGISGVENTIRKIKDKDPEEFSAPLESFLEICGQTEDKSKIDFSIVNKSLKLAIKAKEQTQAKIKTQFEEQEKGIQKTIDDIKEKRTSLEKEIELKDITIQENKNEIEELRKRLISLEGSQEILALLEDDEQKFTEKIEAIEKSGIIGKCEEEMKLINQETVELEEKLKKTNGEVSILTEDKSRTEKISIYTKQKIQKNKDCSDIMSQAEDRLRAILGNVNLEDDNIPKTLDTKIKEFRKEIKEKELEIKKKDYEVAKSEQELKQVKKELEKKEAQLDEWKDQVAEVLEGRSFDVFSKEVSDKLDSLQKKDYYSDASQFLYKKYVQKLNSKPCCPLCKRDFEKEEEAANLITQIETDIENLNKNGPSDKATIQKMKLTNKSLMEMKPLWLIVDKLESIEIPELKKRREVLEEKVVSLKETLEDLNATLLTLKNDYNIACDLTKSISIFEQHKKELKKIEDSIAKIERDRDPKAKECSMNLPQAQLELSDLQGRIRSKRQRKDELAKSKKENQDELSRNQQEKNKIKEEKLKITSEFQNRDANEARKKELEEANRNLAELIAEMNKTLPSFKSEIAAQDKAKIECCKQKEEQMNTVRQEKDFIDRQYAKVNEIKHQIEEFEVHRSNHVEKQKKFGELKLKLTETSEKKKEYTETIEEMKGDISSAEFKKRDLNDNLALKRREAEIVKFKEELSNYEKLLEETKNQGLNAEIRTLNTKYNEYSAKMNELKGSRKQKLSTQRVLEHELSKSPLLTADDDYRAKLVRKTVYEKAQIDLRIYKKALDIAIVEFHKKRMEAINRKLRELWRKIYKGNDIDYIEIKCDDDDEGRPPGKVETSSRKTYAYRVITNRRGIELDMRNRCSAGQKILASLIIRIALAEAFSSKCGVITLDEPTTNLDQANANALADTLADLAISMQESRTFQLVVITHDEQFIERLLRIDPVELYYKVTRDRKGHSIIRQYTKE